MSKSVGGTVYAGVPPLQIDQVPSSLSARGKVLSRGKGREFCCRTMSVVVYTECPSGRWGVGCQEICQCHHYSGCDAVTGECLCLPGWFGPTCSQGTSTLSVYQLRRMSQHSQSCEYFRSLDPKAFCPRPSKFTIRFTPLRGSGRGLLPCFVFDVDSIE